MRKKTSSPLLLLIFLSVINSTSKAQMKFEGTHAPNKEVLALLEREAKITDSARNVIHRQCFNVMYNAI